MDPLSVPYLDFTFFDATVEMTGASCDFSNYLPTGAGAGTWSRVTWRPGTRVGRWSRRTLRPGTRTGRWSRRTWRPGAGTTRGRSKKYIKQIWCRSSQARQTGQSVSAVYKSKKLVG